MISFSAAVIGAGRFLSLATLSALSVEVDVPAVDLKTFGRFSGLVFRGLTDLRGFILKPVRATGAGGAVGLAANDRTTFSEFSSRLRPSSTGIGGELDSRVSAAARSICSAISCRSRCSSEIVALSFFWEAS